MEHHTKERLKTLQGLIGKEALIELRGGSEYSSGPRMRVKILAVVDQSGRWVISTSSKNVDLEDVFHVEGAEENITGMYFLFTGPPLPPPREFDRFSPGITLHFNEEDAQRESQRLRTRGFNPHLVSFSSGACDSWIDSWQLSELFRIRIEMQKRWLQGDWGQGSFWQLFFYGVFAERQWREHFSKQEKEKKEGE